MNINDLLNEEQIKAQQDNEILFLIRQRYSADDECAILRKKLANIDTKGEFDEYNSYVEECKKKIKGV